MPFGVYGLIGGAVLPFVIAAVILASGMVTLALHQRGEYEQAAAGQIYTMIAVGLLLTLAEPQLADPGLAIMLMGAVLSSLLARQRVRQQSFLVLGGLIAAVLLAWLVVPPLAVKGTILVPTSIATFVYSLVMVLHSANRINSAYEVYDKSQMAAYRHFIEHVRDGVIRFSGEGEILLASKTSETLFGCRRFELTSQSLSERLHVLDRPIYLTAFADANQDGKVRTIEVRMRQDQPHAGGQPHFIWVEIGFSPVLEDAHGPGYEVVALFRNVSQRKDNEVAMAQARHEAEEASEAKSRFLATIGHELRTPLNAVVGFSEMMSTGIGGELSGTHREYAGLIHKSGKHLLEVVGMLLDMSKIEAGKFELQTEPFHFQDVVETSLGMVENIAKDRGIRLHADISPNLPLLVADERACRQIVLNLVSNAIKFSHEGGTVTVSLKRQGVSLNLSVSDRGIGMAPEAIKRIGEPFFQAQDGLSRRYEGTGLGLSIVKGLVDLHQGTLRAVSELGAGTSVTVLLPINGPAIKTEESAVVTPLRKEPAAAPEFSWQDEKRKAQ